MTLTTQAQPPEIRKKLLMADFKGGNNKDYLLEAWPLGYNDLFTVKMTWGRVGALNPQSKVKTMSRYQIEKLLQEKVEKGYNYLDLHSPSSVLSLPSADISAPALITTAQIHPKVETLVQDIFSEAGESIASFLSVSLDALSQRQIKEGRVLLNKMTPYTSYALEDPTSQKWGIARDMVLEFMRVIPTKAPARLSRIEVQQDLIQGFMRDLYKQEERLDALEAGLATVLPSVKTEGQHPYERLGCEIEWIEHPERDAPDIVEYIKSKSHHSRPMKLLDIYKVHIPPERDAFLQNERGKSRIETLSHGTHTKNVRHILHNKGKGSGLRVPQHSQVSNGSAYGRGIYLGYPAKNYSYVSSTRAPKIILICDTAIGKHYTPPTSHDYKGPPEGYDSLWAIPGTSDYIQFAEVIVFQANQVTIKYVATFQH